MPHALLPVLFLASASFESAHAQQPPSSSRKNIPIRQLGPILAASKDTLGPRITVRGFSNGSVLVGVFPFQLGLEKRRVKLFDSTLQHVTVVRDSSHPPTLIKYLGDSTLVLDAPSRSMVLLDAHGKVVRTSALPKTTDFGNLTGFVRTPYIDPKGRLIYQGATPPPPPKTGSDAPIIQTPFQPDSAPIVRGDFDTRKVDTIATIKTALQAKFTAEQVGQSISIKAVFNPTATADEWTMLADGTIAIVRAHDYHVDFVDPDGTRRSAPKLPFDWKRITDERKQFTIDSLKPGLDSARLQQAPRTIDTPDGPRPVIATFEVLAADKWPDYEPPIGPGSVRADLDNNLWVVPRTTAAAQGGGLLYDVINRQGEIIERVQLPKGVAIVGFGPNGMVYLIRVEGIVAFLERARVR